MSSRNVPDKSGKAPSLGENARSTGADIDAFLSTARALAKPNAGGTGRLVLSLDATMSRQPTWDLACELQGEMFDAAGKAGGLEVQLVYFRGLGECRASRFVSDTSSLKKLMSAIECRGGHTQIGRVLRHLLAETARAKLSSAVFIGDAMEEKVDDLADAAGRLGLAGVPVFMFQEGNDSAAEKAFREIARLSRGAWFRFDRHSASHLSALLGAVAVYAAGGVKALAARGRPEDRLMIEHLGGGR